MPSSGLQFSPAPHHALGRLTQEGRSLQGVMLLVTYRLETRRKVGILLGGGGQEWGPWGGPRAMGWPQSDRQVWQGSGMGSQEAGWGY